MLSIIVAMGNNNVIGIDNKLPWHIPDDLKYFKEKTLNKSVIMGRKTLESLGKPLKERKNVVLTRDKSYAFKNSDVEIVHDISEINKYIFDDKENFVIGGAEIYKMLMPYCECLYITKIYKDFAGDKYFEKIDEGKWKLIESQGVREYLDIKYEFLVYKKIK